MTRVQVLAVNRVRVLYRPALLLNASSRASGLMQFRAHRGRSNQPRRQSAWDWLAEFCGTAMLTERSRATPRQDVGCIEILSGVVIYPHSAHLPADDRLRDPLCTKPCVVPAHLH